MMNNNFIFLWFVRVLVFIYIFRLPEIQFFSSNKKKKKLKITKVKVLLRLHAYDSTNDYTFNSLIGVDSLVTS
jgi:hypothetical protein